MKTIVFLMTLVFSTLMSRSQDAGGLRTGKERSPVILKEKTDIFTTTTVNAISPDSIMVTVTFHNHSGRSFWLYKPLLPSGSSRLKLFSLFSKKDYEDVELKNGPDKTTKFYSGRYNVLPIVIPDTRKDNFIELRHDDSMSFSENIASSYDFKKMTAGKRKEFVIAYMTIFPAITNMEPEKEKDPVDSKLKPVYYTITSKQVNGEITRETFTLR